jgi:drug/metabolite transporter (DMT)-like permease
MPVILILSIGVLAISSASIIIRLLPDVPALSIAAWRLIFSSLLTYVLVFKKGDFEKPEGRDFFLSIAAGLFLAVHFSLWITSIKLTTIASAVVLGTTTPIWVSIVSHFLLRERNTRSEWIGIIVAVIGGVLVGYGDINLTTKAILGDALALASAWAISGYFILGRSLRKRLSLTTYTTIVYTASAAFLAIFCALSGVPLAGYSRREFFLLFLLALFPQIIGHNALNWALARLKASVVTLSVLFEAVISGTLAAVLFGEIPPTIAFAGYFLIMFGLIVVSRETARNEE